MPIACSSDDDDMMRWGMLNAASGVWLLHGPDGVFFCLVQVAHNYQRQDQLFHKVLHLPVALAAVSEAVRTILQRQFGRSSLLIPNGVDCDRFFPGPPAAAAPTAVLASPSKGHVQARFDAQAIVVLRSPSKAGCWCFLHGSIWCAVFLAC